MNKIDLADELRKVVRTLLEQGRTSHTITLILQDCFKNTKHPNNYHNEKQNLINAGKTLRKNRSIARALTENGSKNNILKKTKLNIEMLNDQLIKLQTQQGKNLSLEDASKFSRAIRALSEAAKNDLAMHNVVENNIKQQQAQKLHNARKQGAIDQQAMNKAMQILGLSI